MLTDLIPNNSAVTCTAFIMLHPTVRKSWQKEASDRSRSRALDVWDVHSGCKAQAPPICRLYDGKVGDWQAIQVSFWAERIGTVNVPKILEEKSNVILLAEGRTEIRICKCRINMVIELKSRTRKEVKNISACIMVVCHSRKLMETQRSRAGCSDRQDKNMSWILTQFWGFAFD